MDKTNINFLKPFGPVIAKVTIPKKLIDKLNEYCDATISDEKKSAEQDHGGKLVGNVTKEIRLEDDFITKCGWLEFLGRVTKQYVEFGTMEKKVTKFNLINSWIVSQFKNEYNPTHWHGGHVSGAGYLKVPKNLGKPFQESKKTNYNGCLQLVHGSKQFLSPSLYHIEPKIGDFYLFPNYLMHTVYPFTDTDEERRCVSFNAFVNEEVYNVYS